MESSLRAANSAKSYDHPTPDIVDWLIS